MAINEKDLFRGPSHASPYELSTCGNRIGILIGERGHGVKGDSVRVKAERCF